MVDRCKSRKFHLKFAFHPLYGVKNTKKGIYQILTYQGVGEERLFQFSFFPQNYEKQRENKTYLLLKQKTSTIRDLDNKNHLKYESIYPSRRGH